MKKNFIFILPEFKDGGGNRWSVNLANSLAPSYNVKLFALKKKNIQTIHKLDLRIKSLFFDFNSNNFLNRMLLYLKIFLLLRKKKYKNNIIVISDPVLSILSILLYPKRIIRNVAADENNLFNSFNIYYYTGLVYIYKLLLKLSFCYPNTNYFFISKYVFLKTPYYFKKKFIKTKLNLHRYFISPSIDDSYLDLKNINTVKQKIKTICLFPRKQNSKGKKIYYNTEFQNELLKLGITNIILISNEKININKIIHQKVKIVKPTNDLDIIHNLDLCDLFISTSTNEGFSLPPIEAMARKKPVVMANAGGNLSYAYNGYNCLLYENNEIDKIISKIKIVVKNRHLREYITDNGYQTAQYYRSSIINKKWLKNLFSQSDYLDNNNKNEILKSNILKKSILSNHKKYLLIFKSLDKNLITTLIFELFFFPMIIIANFIKLNFNLPVFKFKKKIYKRKRIIDEFDIKLCIQDWSKYKNTRYKLLKNLNWYKCGLSNINELFKTKKYNVKKYLFLSDYNHSKLKGLNVKKEFEIINSTNFYYDFSSYNLFFKMNKKLNNILIFCNSSISSEISDNFLDGYLEYFIKNKNLGLLGISGNSKNYQSLIFNNFTPHIQTIFFITTVEVLNNVIKSNNNQFPGINATAFNKYSIIKKGEIILTKKVLELGYDIGIVKPDGNVFNFYKDSSFKMYNNWKVNYKLGDARLHNILPSYPFMINL
jgi:glycosyltransferase involved in cell wall biosynthesis